ncbi:MAG: hypothetical protein E7Z92_01855 [Cyanobacteria bacterium SIG31]|nr:hypothetical protein [Cyanobacteria bacterium SIG31]
MNNQNNSAKIYTGTSGGELKISLNNTKQIISATNNKAQYFAELAEKYKNEAKEHRDNAQYYAEQNSDVTITYIESIKNSLEEKISEKQDSGDYALKSEIPVKVSELANDLEYTTFDAVIPEQYGNSKKVLCTDGEKLYWETKNTHNLFDIKLYDYILNYEESQGWALQGSYVYKEAIAGTRYGYPDFYNKCLDEFNAATATQITLGTSTITIKEASNGHQYYDINDKDAVDTFYDTMGSAWFYGVDTANERIFLPRNKYFAINGVNNETPVAGNGNALGITTNGSDVRYANQTTSSTNVGLTLSTYTATTPQLVGTNLSSGGDISLNATKWATGITSNPEMSGIVADTSNVLKLDDTKYLYICVGNTTNYEGVTNVIKQGMEILEQVNQGIESRIDTDISNISMVGKNLLTFYGKPSDRYLNLTLLASGSTYTLPANGWVALCRVCNGANSYASLSGKFKSLFSGEASEEFSIFIPVQKNESISCIYSDLKTGQANDMFRFYYDEGAE